MVQNREKSCICLRPFIIQQKMQVLIRKVVLMKFMLIHYKSSVHEADMMPSKVAKQMINPILYCWREEQNLSVNCLMKNFLHFLPKPN